MKMKLPDLSGKVIVMKTDQEEARKCYENSLKTKRGVVMVIERPLVSDSRMELEPLEEATLTEPMPVETIPAGATPIEDAHTEGRYGDAPPMEEESEEAMPVESTPVEVMPIGATPIKDVCTEENGSDSSPMEEVYSEASPMEEASEEVMPDASDRATPIEEDQMNESRAENVQNEQPQPVDNVVKRPIGGKVFKLGRFLSQEEQEEVAAVISRHLDAFAWTAVDMPGIDPDFLYHHLNMDAKVRPVQQRRRKFNEERCLVVKEET